MASRKSIKLKILLKYLFIFITFSLST